MIPDCGQPVLDEAGMTFCTLPNSANTCWKVGAALAARLAAAQDWEGGASSI